MRISDWSSDVCSSDLKGWDYAKFLLSRERGMVAQSWLIRHEVERAKAFARDQRDGDATLWDDDAYRRKVARLEIQLKSLRWQMQRLLTDATPSVAASTAAIRSEEHTSKLKSLMRNSYAVLCLKN